jgi:hypothetical protein
MRSPSPSLPVPLRSYREATGQIAYTPLHADRNPSAHRKSGSSATSRRVISLNWAIEILSLVISIASTVAAIVVLGLYDRRPQSDWQHDITLNTIVSILAVVIKASLLTATASCISQLKWTRFVEHERALVELEAFDAASRGIGGSLRLIFSPSLWHAAVLGAVVMVTAIAIGPCTQQAITYPVHAMNVSTASIPRTQQYDILEVIPLTLKSAAYNGLFDAKKAMVTAQCGTGNCTFPPYTSLAICNKCADVSAFVGQHECYQLGSNRYCSRYSLPNNVTMNGSSECLSSSFANSTNVDLLESYGSDVANLSILISPSYWGPGSTVDIQAYDCTFYFCLQKYQASFENNVFVETVNDEYVPSVPSPFATGIDYDFTAPATFVLPDEEEDFTLSLPTFEAVRSYLSTLLVGQAFGFGAQTSYTSDVINAMYNTLSFSSNGTSIFQSLTRSMTADIRTNPGISPSVYNVALGAATQDVTYLHVRWPWLVLPLVLQVLGILLLGLTMVSTSRTRTPLWKSSVLAALLMEPSQQIAVKRPILLQRSEAITSDNDAPVPRTNKDLKARARTMRVRLLV